MTNVFALKVASVEALAQNAEAKKSVADAVAGKPSIMEPKLDGWRLLCTVDAEGTARTFTRTGNELTGSLPAIEAALVAALPPGSTLDAEAVAFEVGDDGLPQHKWGSVQSILGSGTAKAALCSGKITLVVFDLIQHGGLDARSLPLAKRRELLDAIFDSGKFAGTKVVLVPQFEATEAGHEAIIAAGYEGSMVKWTDAPYGSGHRGAGWWKLKATATVDVIVMGYKEGTPGSAFDGYVGAIIFGQHDADGNLVERGRCSGLDWDERVRISENRDEYLGRVFEMRHMGVMPPGKDYPLGAFRHPQWKRWRPDKPAEAVVIHDA